MYDLRTQSEYYEVECDVTLRLNRLRTNNTVVLL